MMVTFPVTYSTPAQLSEMLQYAVAHGFEKLRVDAASATLTIEADVQTGEGYFVVPESIDELLNKVEVRDFDFDPMVDISGLSRLDLLHYVACTLTKRGEIPIVCISGSTKKLAASVLGALPLQNRLFSRFGRLELLIGVAGSFVDSERMTESADNENLVILLTANNPNAKQDECTRAWSVLLPAVPTRLTRGPTDV